MIEIGLEPYVSLATLADVRHAYKKIHNGAARLIRIPAIEFADAVQKAVNRFPWQPFKPTLYGLPVDQTANEYPEIIVVFDDDTNATVNVIRQEGI